MKLIKEGKAKIYADEKHEKKISKELEVFYNPKMEMNRDISILFLKSISKLKILKKEISVGLPLAGSGIRGIRLLKETKFIKYIYLNDYDKTAVKNIQKNIKLNKVDKNNIHISNKDANLFLLESKGFDYIDLDPFGSPNPFLDSSIQRMSRNGILAVTATDTAALTGTYPSTTRWKYWATNYLCPEKHELALRILIRKIQLIGTQYQRALIPLFSYTKEHYYRIFFICEKSKTKAAEIIKQHNYYTPFFQSRKIGPMWTGQLVDVNVIKKMIQLTKNSELDSFLELIKKESEIDNVGFIDLHEFAKKNKIEGLKHEVFMENLKKKGFKASRTHFSYKAIKTDAPYTVMMKIIKEK